MERLTNSGTKEARSDVTIRQVLDKLADYEDLEEKRKLLRLENEYQKIMIGEDVFVITSGSVKSGRVSYLNEWWNDYDGFRGEYKAISNEKCGNYFSFKYEDFGEIVFFTEKEAETALKKMQISNEQLINCDRIKESWILV